MSPADTHGDRIVVGLFDRQEDATAVIHELQDDGVPASSIHTDEREGAKPTLLQRLRRIVTGKDSHELAEGVRRGGIVVSAMVPEARVPSAIAVMERHHAVDIEKRSETWQGWRSPEPGEGPPPEDQGPVRVYSRSVEPPIGDVTVREEHVVIERRPANRPPDESQGLYREQPFDEDLDAVEVLVVQEAHLVAEVPRQDRGAEAHPFAADFERDFRARYEPAGAAWDLYEAAYRWGYMLANQDEWRGRPWDDVEAYAERSWEERRPGTWERFKDAIRYGWDRLTGRTSHPAGG